MFGPFPLAQSCSRKTVSLRRQIERLWAPLLMNCFSVRPNQLSTTFDESSLSQHNAIVSEGLIELFTTPSPPNEMNHIERLSEPR